MTQAIQTTPILAPAAAPSPAVSQQSIADILTMLGIYMSEIMNVQNSSTNSQAQISENICQRSSAETQTYVSKLKQQDAQITKTNKSVMGKFDKIIGNKWVQVAITAAVGLMLCETPLGFAMLAATIALQASGALTDASKGLGKAMGGSPAANLFASLLVVGVLTAGSGFAEGAGMMGLVKGLTSLQTALPEEMAPMLDKLLVTCGEKIATETTEKEAASAAEDGAEQASSNTKFFRPGNATLMAGSTALCTTDPVSYFLEMTGVGKEKAEMYGEIICAITSAIAVMGTAAVKGFISTSQDVMASSVKLTRFVQSGTTALQTGTLVAKGSTGMNELQFANMQHSLAPIAGQVSALQALVQFFSGMIGMNKNEIENLVKAEGGANQLNLAYGWETVAQGMQA